MNDIKLMEEFIKDIKNKKDFKEYLPEEHILKYKNFSLYSEDYFNFNILNTLYVLIEVFKYFENKGIKISIDNDLRKIILLQSVPENKENKPKNKIIKLNELKNEKKFWITDPKIRYSVVKLYPATLFYKKHKKFEEIGRQKKIKDLSLKDNDKFVLEDLILFTNENRFPIQQLIFSLSKIREYILFRKKILNISKN